MNDKKYIIVGLKWVEEKKDYEQIYIICEYLNDALNTFEDMKIKGYNNTKLFEGEQIPLF